VSDDRIPVIVGVAQLVQRDADPKEALEPLAMLLQVARGAAEDARGGDRLLRDLDTVAVVSVANWEEQNAPRFVAQHLGAKPTQEYTSEMGGQIGVTMANLVARKITEGKTRAALIAGCNNLRTVVKAYQKGIALDWKTGGTGTPEMVGSLDPGSSELEAKYGMVMPPDIYPIFENAVRAARGLTLDAHRARLGRLFSRFTEVASKNPYAWFPVARTPAEITTEAPQNRMIAYPYTKYMNAILNTDQAAGLILCSVAKARELGIPEDRWVYWWGGAESQEQAWFASERPSFARCPSMLDAHRGALDNAGLDIGQIDRIDFYSCFPVAVEMAAEQLGLSLDDPRGFTVTGGLPYAGGPASAYTLHSLASMADRLRERAGAKGLVTGNGWYLTKHAASVWATERKPGAIPVGTLPSDLPSRTVATAPAKIDEGATGKGTVEAYTVVYDREGAPARGIVLGRTAAGRRFLANTPADRALLEAFVAAEQVGREGALSQQGGLTVFDPA